MADSNEMVSRHNVLLGAMCMDYEGEEKFIEIPFSFEGKDLWETHEDCRYDDLNTNFNDWLQNNGYKGWFIDDEIVFVVNQESINPKAVMVE
jgi:hypothetical protein